MNYICGKPVRAYGRTPPTVTPEFAMATDTSTKPHTIGAYDLLAKIAEGGMGAVYKARSHQSGDIVAIKIIPSETAKNPTLLRRFEQEFRAASLLDHPNVVRAIEYCGTGTNPFLVMEYVDGQSLGRRVDKGGKLEESLALHIIAQVCDGLHRAHKQSLVHRDVKPDNIIVTNDGVAKLTDLGLVKDIDGELNLTRTGRGLGTPHFMAPEQFRNAKNANVRCDIYSLGATLYMMLTGVVPFAKTSPLDCWMKKSKNDFPPPKALNPAVSDRVNWAVQRAMSADPDMRPASCRELLEDLTGQTWQGWTTTKGDTPDPSGEPVKDLWYLVYKNPAGQSQKVKGTTDSIRQNVRAQMLGDSGTIMVCRTKHGPFVPLKGTPEFRDLVVSASTVETARPSGKFASPWTTDTTRSPVTIPQSGAFRRDPAIDIPTTVHKVAQPRIPMKTTSRTRTIDYMPWVILALAVAAATVGIIVFTR